MKVRKIKVRTKSVKSILDDFVKTWEAIERGEKVKRERHLLHELGGIQEGTHAETHGTPSYHQNGATLINK